VLRARQLDPGSAGAADCASCPTRREWDAAGSSYSTAAQLAAAAGEEPAADRPLHPSPAALKQVRLLYVAACCPRTTAATRQPSLPELAPPAPGAACGGWLTVLELEQGARRARRRGLVASE
jgi:hypothetical protein